MANDNDAKGETNDTANAEQPGKGAGAEKGDLRREYSRHSGQTRNSPGARRTEEDEQSGSPNRN